LQHEFFSSSPIHCRAVESVGIDADGCTTYSGHGTPCPHVWHECTEHYQSRRSVANRRAVAFFTPRIAGRAAMALKHPGFKKVAASIARKEASAKAKRKNPRLRKV
jgi:hypothetical protein